MSDKISAISMGIMGVGFLITGIGGVIDGGKLDSPTFAISACALLIADLLWERAKR